MIQVILLDKVPFRFRPPTFLEFSSYPVPLLIEETLSLVENLLVGLFLGDVCGKVRSVGVDLRDGEC